jgi:hypothetical protein
MWDKKDESYSGSEIKSGFKTLGIFFPDKMLNYVTDLGSLPEHVCFAFTKN